MMVQRPESQGMDAKQRSRKEEAPNYDDQKERKAKIKRNRPPVKSGGLRAFFLGIEEYKGDGDNAVGCKEKREETERPDTNSAMPR